MTNTIAPTVTDARQAEDLRLVSEIKWISDDRDNMQFKARITCYQRDALNRILASRTPASPTSDDVERCIAIAEAVRKDFLSEEYAVGQPLSSFNERFACDRIIQAIADEFGITAMQPPQSTGDVS